MIWIIGTWLTPAESDETLRKFVAKVQPGGPGWKRFAQEDHSGVGWAVPRGVLSMLFGSAGVYATLFAVGSWLYDDLATAWLLAGVAVISVLIIVRLNRRRA
jgi:hypothetical protein